VQNSFVSARKIPYRDGLCPCTYGKIPYRDGLCLCTKGKLENMRLGQVRQMVAMA